MNWNRGILRITLILSIIGAIIGGVLSFYKAKERVTFWEKRLREERSYVYSDEDERLWIDYWKDPVVPGHFNEPLIDRQQRTLDSWMKEKSRQIFLIHDELNDTEAEQYKAMLIKKREEKLESLKEKGWKTLNGETMPITPEEVWTIYNQVGISSYENLAKAFRSFIPRKTAEGAFYGLCAVWITYLILKFGAWPVYKWISRGFAEDKQNDS